MPIRTIIGCDRTTCHSQFEFQHPSEGRIDIDAAFSAAEDEGWFGTDINICPRHAEPADVDDVIETTLNRGMDAVVREFKERFPGHDADIDMAHEAAATIENQ